MKELSLNFKIPAVGFLLIAGWLVYTTISLKTTEHKMATQAEEFLVSQLEKWKNGEETVIAHFLPSLVSFTRDQWENVVLLDYKIEKIRSVTRYRRNYFNFGYGSRYKSVFDHVEARVLLTLEDENGVESTEEVVYKLYPRKHNWRISN